MQVLAVSPWSEKLVGRLRMCLIVSRQVECHTVLFMLPRTIAWARGAFPGSRDLTVVDRVPEVLRH